MERGGVNRPIFILFVARLRLWLRRGSLRFFASLKSEGWSGREDLNLRLPAPKARRLLFEGL